MHPTSTIQPTIEDITLRHAGQIENLLKTSPPECLSITVQTFDRANEQAPILLLESCAQRIDSTRWNLSEKTDTEALKAMVSKSDKCRIKTLSFWHSNKPNKQASFKETILLNQKKQIEAEVAKHDVILTDGLRAHATTYETSQGLSILKTTWIYTVDSNGQLAWKIENERTLPRFDTVTNDNSLETKTTCYFSTRRALTQSTNRYGITLLERDGRYGVWFNKRTFYELPEGVDPETVQEKDGTFVCENETESYTLRPHHTYMRWEKTNLSVESPRFDPVTTHETKTACQPSTTRTLTQYTNQHGIILLKRDSDDTYGIFFEKKAFYDLPKGVDPETVQEKNGTFVCENETESYTLRPYQAYMRWEKTNPKAELLHVIPQSSQPTQQVLEPPSAPLNYCLINQHGIELSAKTLWDRTEHSIKVGENFYPIPGQTDHNSVRIEENLFKCNCCNGKILVLIQQADKMVWVEETFALKNQARRRLNELRDLRENILNDFVDKHTDHFRKNGFDLKKDKKIILSSLEEGKNLEESDLQFYQLMMDMSTELYLLYNLIDYLQFDALTNDQLRFICSQPIDPPEFSQSTSLQQDIQALKDFIEKTGGNLEEIATYAYDNPESVKYFDRISRFEQDLDTLDQNPYTAEPLRPLLSSFQGQRSAIKSQDKKINKKVSFSGELASQLLRAKLSELTEASLHSVLGQHPNEKDALQWTIDVFQAINNLLFLARDDELLMIFEKLNSLSALDKTTFNEFYKTTDSLLYPLMEQLLQRNDQLNENFIKPIINTLRTPEDVLTAIAQDPDEANNILEDEYFCLTQLITTAKQKQDPRVTKQLFHLLSTYKDLLSKQFTTDSLEEEFEIYIEYCKEHSRLIKEYLEAIPKDETAPQSLEEPKNADEQLKTLAEPILDALNTLASHLGAFVDDEDKAMEVLKEEFDLLNNLLNRAAKALQDPTVHKEIYALISQKQALLSRQITIESTTADVETYLKHCREHSQLMKDYLRVKDERAQEQ